MTEHRYDAGYENYIERLHGHIDRLRDENCGLVDENEKLRKLVSGLLYCALEDADAHDCPLYDEFEPYLCLKDKLLSDLGIEEPSDDQEG